MTAEPCGFWAVFAQTGRITKVDLILLLDPTAGPGALASHGRLNVISLPLTGNCCIDPCLDAQDPHFPRLK